MVIYLDYIGCCELVYYFHYYYMNAKLFLDQCKINSLYCSKKQRKRKLLSVSYRNRCDIEETYGFL